MTVTSGDKLAVADITDGFLVNVNSRHASAFIISPEPLPPSVVPGDLLLTINNPTPSNQDLFGISVASTPNGNIIVGAISENTGVDNAGSVYLFFSN